MVPAVFAKSSWVINDLLAVSGMPYASMFQIICTVFSVFFLPRVPASRAASCEFGGKEHACQYASFNAKVWYVLH